MKISGFEWTLILCLTTGHLLTSFPCIVAESRCREPFVWLKGCHRQPRPENMALTRSLTNNCPAVCFQTCGDSTELVALHLDECACLKTDSRLLFQAEFLCDTPCKGDGNVDCGGNGGWSLYQKVSDEDINSMKMPSNSTGCGYVSYENDMWTAGIGPCSIQRQVRCTDRLFENCNDESTAAKSTWGEAIENCKFLSSVLPHREICRTVVRFDSYWMGLYRQKDDRDMCEFSTATETATTEKPLTSNSTTTFSVVATHTQTTMQTSTSLNSEKTTKSAYMPVSSETTSATTASTIQIGHSGFGNLDFSTTNSLESSSHMARDSKVPLTAVPKSHTHASLKSVQSYSQNSTLTKLRTYKSPMSSFTTLREKSVASDALSTGEMNTSASTVKPRTNENSKPVTQPPKTIATFHLNKGVEKIKASSSSIMQMENTDKITIVVSVIGTLMCTILFSIFLLLCRISRILQKKRNGNFADYNHMKQKRPLKFTYLTDKEPGGMFSGQQFPGFPYNSLYRNPGRTKRHTREMKKNTYRDWYNNGSVGAKGKFESDRYLNYSETSEGKVDNYSSSEEEERYRDMDRIWTTGKNEADNIV